MNTHVKAITLGIALTALVLTHVGCVVEEEVSMLVVGNEALATSCDLSGDTNGPFLSRGTMDIALTKRFVMAPVLLNQLGSSFDVQLNTGGSPELDDSLIEGNTVILEGAEVTFTTNIPGLQAVFSSDLFIPIGGTVFPQSSAAIGLEVISEALGRQVEGTTLFTNRGTLVTILVNIRFEGKTTSGTEVKSTEFSFPLDICSGCLLNYPPGTLFQDDDGSQTCDVSKDPNNTGTAAAQATTESVCIFGQDALVDCRLCRSAVGDPVRADVVCDPN